MRGHEFTKVVENQTCKHFLHDELRPFRVEARQTNRILQITERSFNAPTHAVKRLELYRREQRNVEVGEEIFKAAWGDFDSHNAQVQWVEARMMEIAEIEAACLGNKR